MSQEGCDLQKTLEKALQKMPTLGKYVAMRIKKTLSIVYLLLIALMALGTIVGKYTSVEMAADQFFGAWWFTLLWAVGVALGVAYFIQQRVRRPLLVLLHLSFVVILLGALLTHLTAKKGIVHLRQGKPVTTYSTKTGEQQPLPFTLKLNRFRVSYHAGNMAAMDYASEITILHDKQVEHYQVAMNKIYTGYGVRLYQSSFDDDMRGSYLAVNADPYGIPVTYVGYALLFIGLVGMLVDKRGRFRQLLRQSKAQRAAIVGLLLCIFAPTHAQTALSQATAAEFGKVLIVYNGRICPLETFAIEFTKKLYGSQQYQDYTPCQVLTGFLFWPSEWMKAPILKVKSKALREQLQLNEYISPMRLFGQQGYILGPYLQEAQNQQSNMAKALLDVDDKMMLLMSLTKGDVLKLYPYVTPNGQVDWFAPTDKLPRTMPVAQQKYIRSILNLANQLAHQGRNDMLNDLVHKLQRYQVYYGGTTLPSPLALKAEHLYNHFPFTTILFMVNLTLGLCSIFFLAQRKRYVYFTIFMGLAWGILTFTLALRWIINGTIPMANGYETMLLLSWLIMFVSLLTTRTLKLMTTFGLLMSGFMLLVSHIGEMDPNITPRMPVLNSPLLSIHVSIIMMAYALLSLTFISALAYFLTSRSHRKGMVQMSQQLTLLSQLFLYPAMTTLGLGIFIGAIWANISWGTYWSWDPKETWALITFMVYAVLLHPHSLPSLQRPRIYHLYCLCAFLTLLMTYFGVNYFLGGMHSYA